MANFLCNAKSVFEESHGNSTGAGMGADHAANGGVANLLQTSFPKPPTVLDVLEQQRVGQAGIPQEQV